MFRVLLLCIALLRAKEVFSGNVLMYEVILESKLTVLIKPKCQECMKITQLLESQHVDYNVLQTVTLVCTFKYFTFYF